MIDRINLILKAKNITARQFAEEIGIQASGMSHILGGRNNPSLDFVTKVIRRYPEIDANWLIMGRGEMYTGSTPTGFTPPAVAVEAETESRRENSLFPELDDQSVQQPMRYDEPQTVAPPLARAGEPSGYVPTYMAVPPDELMHGEVPLQQTEPESTPVSQKNSRRMVRLLFIYSDGTFEECLPATAGQQ